MTGEQLRPLENRPYLDQWQKRMEAKPVKSKPHKKGKKRKVKK